MADSALKIRVKVYTFQTRKVESRGCDVKNRAAIVIPIHFVRGRSRRENFFLFSQLHF